MKKLLSSIVAIGMTLCLSNAFAQPSAKATAQVGDLTIVDLSGSADPGDDISGEKAWTTLFTQAIKTPTGKDLFIDVSLECGLTTDTTVMSRKLAKAVADAEATVEVQVLVDDIAVPVNGQGDTDITFARRHQSMIAEFAGDFSDCMILTDTDADGINDTIAVDWECTDPETLQLILDTMQANSFNFIAPDLTADTHTVKVQAKLSYEVSGNIVEEIIDDELLIMAEGQAAARAYLGNGSVTIETVRMIKDEDVVVDLE